MRPGHGPVRERPIPAVDAHVWKHTRREDKYVTVTIDLTPIRDGTGPARLLDMVAGRSRQALKIWLAERPDRWREGRAGCARGAHAPRGISTDPAWANRRLLLRGTNSLSARGWERLDYVFAVDDPTGQLEWAWAVKDHTCMLLATTTLDGAGNVMRTLHAFAKAAATPETDRLVATLEASCRAIEVLIVTGITNARTEAANTTVKNIKRTVRGFRNENHYMAPAHQCREARSVNTPQRAAINREAPDWRGFRPRIRMIAAEPRAQFLHFVPVVPAQPLVARMPHEAAGVVNGRVRRGRARRHSLGDE